MTEEHAPYGDQASRSFDDRDLITLMGDLMADVQIRAEQEEDNQLQEWLYLLGQIHNYIIDRLEIDAVKEEGQE